MEMLFKDLGVGNLITIVLALLGGFASYITLRGDVKDAGKVAADAKTRAEGAQKELDAFKLFTAQTYVSMTSMREFKDDISKEIKDIEHVIRNLLMGKGRGNAV